MRTLIVFAACATLLGSGMSRLYAADVPAPATPTPTCKDCHADHYTNKYPHYPAQEGSCDACHEAKPEHFKAGDKQFVTTNRSQSTCLTCHDVIKNAYVHPALQMGDDSCLNCHNPHGSTESKILRKAVPTLCFDCHDSDSIMKGTSVHGVINGPTSCMACHEAHAAPQPKLLKKPLEEMCLSCHDKEISAGDRIIPNILAKINQPYRMETGGECNNCHYPHSSPLFGRMLRKSFPVKNYNRYTPGKPADGTNPEIPNTYALCFDCHNVAMLNREITNETRFRKDTMNGQTVEHFNLHFAHVTNTGIGSTGPAFGRSCKICHDIHGSPQEHMIKTDIAPGAPVLKYQRLENGGQCSGSCHNVKTYTRIEQ